MQRFVYVARGHGQAGSGAQIAAQGAGANTDFQNASRPTPKDTLDLIPIAYPSMKFVIIRRAVMCARNLGGKGLGQGRVHRWGRALLTGQSSLNCVSRSR